MNHGFILVTGPPNLVFSHHLSRVRQFWILTCNGYALRTGEIILNSKLIAHFVVEKWMWARMTRRSYIAGERAFLYDRSCSKYWNTFSWDTQYAIAWMTLRETFFILLVSCKTSRWLGSEYCDVINRSGTVVRVKMTANICQIALDAIRENLRISEISSSS